MKNFDKCAYTFRHREAFLYVITKQVPDTCPLKTKLFDRARIHDMDKVVNLQRLSAKDASRIHRMTAPHHNISSKSSLLDFAESIIDYECAGYTKPDKPLNAYDFICKEFQANKITAEVFHTYMLLLKYFKMDSSYSVRDLDSAGTKYFDNIQVSVEDIQKSIADYLSLKNLN